ncbi:26979_t:CDS:2, partial [Gigaspora margarita]
EMKQLKVAFQFWNEKNNNNLSYISLMGSDKLKILQNFNLTKVFQLTTQAVQVQNLWNQFYKLYNLMQNKKTTGRVFRAKAQNWLTFFLAPSQDIHNNFGLAIFSCSAIEKKNYIQVCQYFQSTLKDGGHENSRRSAIIEILEHENQ